MNSSCACAEASSSQPCLNYVCFPSQFLVSMVESHETSSKPRPSNATSSNHEFAETVSSTLHPFTHFTNHESLPTLQDSYNNFIKAFPQFSKASKIDEIRNQEYHRLNNHSNNTCFDYNGFGLFSYDQQQRLSPRTSISPSSCSCSSSFFDVSYKSVNLHSQILYGGHESELELRIRERIMRFMNVSESEYTLVFIANEVSAFKLVAESFQFQSNGELLTVYDHDIEAIDMMIQSCKNQGVNTLSSEFSFPNLGIDWRRLKKVIASKREKKKRGLFVFPVRSRVTGTPYSYVWMSMAQENGWHVLLDACSLRPKEMSSLGMSMFKPDFMVCSFYKLFGEDPSGFGCLFVKKTSISALKDSGSSATSMGIVSLVPPIRRKLIPKDSSFIGDDEETDDEPAKVVIETCEDECSEIVMESTTTHFDSVSDENLEIDQCRGLDHADSVGLMLINCRAKYLINWLVNALMSLQHPCPENRLSLIRIYGPKISSHRGPSVAFNLFDWKGEKIDPKIVQKLADRNNISLGNAFLKNIKFLDKNEQQGQRALESRGGEVDESGLSLGLGLGLSKKTQTQTQESGMLVVTAAFGLLTNFEDAYRLWAFISRFLDADFVEKETWRYMALNQKTIDV